MDAVFNRNFKICATCRYWTGSSVRVKSPTLISCDRNEQAICNVNGMTRRAGNSCGCGKYQKKLNL